jgi:alanine dehydrogenase
MTELFSIEKFSTVIVLGLGMVGCVVAVVLGARVWVHQSRAQRLRDHVDSVEARWHEAA